MAIEDRNITPVCPLCRRPIPPHARQSTHHLIPKLKGGKGKPTVLLHEICHRTIHATFTEGELARDFYTIDKLRAQEDIEKFVAWIANKDPAFHARNRAPRRGRRNPR